MTTLGTDKPKGRYISILADGKFHETVSKDREGAVPREYETSTGEKGSKWERTYPWIKGYIKNVQFWKGDYGDMIQVTFASPDEEQVTISQSVKGSFGEDLMRKLPLVDFSKEVYVRPYAFEDSGKKGVSIEQGGVKIGNYFWDGKQSLHGAPEKTEDEDWELYFARSRSFMVKFLRENVIPKFDGEIEYESKTEDPTDFPAF